MKKILILFVPVFLLLSCHKTNQYVYTEVWDDYDLRNRPETRVKKPEIIEAANDSIAYVIAVDKFFKSIYAVKRAEKVLEKAGKSMPVGRPKSFTLLTKDSIDITDGLHLDNPIEIIENTHKKYIELTAKDLN